jgi:hypothetical protein
MANRKFTRAKVMGQVGKVTKLDYQHFYNQIYLHQQLVNEERMEPEAFQTAIGILTEQLTISTPGSKVRSGQKQQTDREGRQQM